jgi:hypothetical protein
MPDSTSVHELKRLADRCLHIVRFLYADLESDSLPMLVDVIERTLEKRDLRGMRAVYRDMCMAAGSVSMARRAVLEQQLQEKWGEGLSNGKKRKDPTGALAIARRGIQSQSDYDIVVRRTNKIERDPGSLDEFELLGLALLTFRNANSTRG